MKVEFNMEPYKRDTSRRNYTIHIRVTEWEKSELQKAAERFHMTLTDYILYCAEFFSINQRSKNYKAPIEIIEEP